MMKINGDRLWDRLMEIAQIGGTPNGGVCRLTLSEEDKKGRVLFEDWCKDLGCSIRVDAMGNLFATYPGKDPHLPALLLGSHLDSQPTGGKYDGVMGVLAGLEVIHTLHDQNFVPDRNIVVASWTNEEGARFTPAMIGSGVFSGTFSLDYAYQQKDKEGITLHDALNSIGYKGTDSVKPNEFQYALELHIEQGPILEREEKQIGIVTGVQGIRWYDIHISGKECHAGPTPMDYRIDPMQSVPLLLTELYKISEVFGEDARITIGYIDASPAVKNTVPEKASISLDIRHPNEDQLTKMHEFVLNVIQTIDKESKSAIALEEIWHSESVVFDDNCVHAVQQASKKLGYPHRRIISGAGHDSVYTSKVIPTSMIFIPCKDGLSHNELESAKKEDVIAGTNVLLHASLQLQHK
ncbi:Zn-dependent hydrolase [Flammeovirga sp. MY04]|uniref:Zn-dependent hydrolase n=1 Tax=Flammeovirga sp. MY04 TaxID=1191459 RepID=UPI00080626B5|nr:Zn-dependent hydrolase [Flammeovirga sp. MY04]ANQ48856.1 Zn-dependent hydrolase [Flammeovirga sp. MY04]